ncbi:hypothetical protein ACFYVL_07065 [Streptomyces sp. NPDC004111]|uniref:hypothetical protein n=1 Tax=Streptomyces sp. NPDC004111 TaxID=3364690 RepID=UPI0036C8B5D6
MAGPNGDDHYGPEVLDVLWPASRTTAEQACTNLHYAAIGDGSAVRAAAEMRPVLVEAARDPQMTVRFEILKTIGALAATGNTAPAAKAAPIRQGP